MDFKTTIKLSKQAFDILEKLKLEKKFSIDSILDKNYPEIVSRLQSYSKINKIAFCATNGKKTVLNLFNRILRENGNSFITNLSSKGKLNPILASIILSLEKSLENPVDSPNKDYYTFAIKEEEIVDCFDYMKFDYLVLNNCFSSHHSNLSLSEKRKRIQEALILNPAANLVVNADDPLFFEIDDIKNDLVLNKKRKKFFFGFDKIEFFNGNKDLSHKNDFLRCPKCSCELEYKKRFYSHLGQYECACGFKRPKLDVSANAKIFSDYTFLEVFYKENKYIFKIPQGGLYSAYNALCAIALAFSLNIERKVITSALESYSTLKAHDEVINYKDKKIKIKMITNSVSFSENLRELHKIKNIKPIFALSDKTEDGIDTSWIWDSNFESLSDFENKIFTTSNRFDDMALRLKYAGVNPCLITMDSSIKSAIECCYWETEQNETIAIYTVPSLVDEIYRILKK